MLLLSGGRDDEVKQGRLNMMRMAGIIIAAYKDRDGSLKAARIVVGYSGELPQ